MARYCKLPGTFSSRKALFGNSRSSTYEVFFIEVLNIILKWKICLFDQTGYPNASQYTFFYRTQFLINTYVHTFFNRAIF